MKKLITIFILLGLRNSIVAQTVLPATTTVYNLSLLKNGAYQIVVGTDTVDITKDTALIVTKTVTIHDTVKIVTVCPPIPTCPPTKQRTATTLTWDAINHRWIIGYDDLSNSAL